MSDFDLDAYLASQKKPPAPAGGGGVFDLDAHLASQSSATTPPAPAPSPAMPQAPAERKVPWWQTPSDESTGDWWRRQFSEIGELGTGAAKGLTSSALGVGEALRSVPVLGDALRGVGEKVADLTVGGDALPQSQAPLSERIATTREAAGAVPREGLEGIGYGAEQIGEFFLPVGSGKAQAAARAGPWLARVGRRLLPEAIKDTAVSTVQGATPGEAGASAVAGAVVPPVASGVVKAIARPFAKSVRPGVGEAAERLGVELPASALTDSRTAQIMESGASKMVAGQQAANRATRALDRLAETTDEIITQADDASAATGNFIEAGRRAMKRQWDAAKESAYASAKVRGIKIDPQDARNAIQGILADGSADPLSQRLARRTLRRITPKRPRAPGRQAGLTAPEPASPKAATGEVDASKVWSEMRRLSGIRWSGDRAVAQGEKALAGKLHKILEDSFLDGVGRVDPELPARIAEANLIHSNGVQELQSAFGRRIARLAKDGQHSRISTELFRPSMAAEDIPRIMAMAGPEAKAGIQQGVMASVLRNSIRGKGLAPKPQGVAGEIRKWTPQKLQAILEPGQYGMLEDLSDVSLAMGDARRITEGSQTAFLANLFKYPAYFWHNPAAATATLAAEAGASAALGSRTGQKWLTEGYGPWAPGVMRATTRGLAPGVTTRGLAPAATIDDDD